MASGQALEVSSEHGHDIEKLEKCEKVEETQTISFSFCAQLAVATVTTPMSALSDAASWVSTLYA